MTETFAQLMELSKLYTGTEDLNEIAIMYQQDEDAILLSYVFCKLGGVVGQVSNRFFGLTEADVDSFALEELHKAMLHFKMDGGAKLATVFSRFLHNRLRMETQANSYDKRSANNTAISIEASTESDDTFRQESIFTPYVEEGYNEVDWLLTLAENPEITDNEYRYCEIILKEVSDPTNINNSEIASRLNVTSAGLHYMKKSLRKKLGLGTDRAVFCL